MKTACVNFITTGGSCKQTASVNSITLAVHLYGPPVKIALAVRGCLMWTASEIVLTLAHLNLPPVEFFISISLYHWRLRQTPVEIPLESPVQISAVLVYSTASSLLAANRRFMVRLHEYSSIRHSKCMHVVVYTMFYSPDGKYTSNSKKVSNSQMWLCELLSLLMLSPYWLVCKCMMA
jgi:hypothetical protein